MVSVGCVVEGSVRNSDVLRKQLKNEKRGGLRDTARRAAQSISEAREAELQ